MKEVGFSWQSIDGERKIVGRSTHPTSGAPTVLVSTGNAPYPHVIAESELDTEIARDERIMVRLAEHNATRVATPEQATHVDCWHEFAAQFTSMKAARVNAVLSKGVRIGGKLGTRGGLIAELVAYGYRAKPSPFKSLRGRVLIHDNETFFTEADITKIGIDFADFMQAKQ